MRARFPWALVLLCFPTILLGQSDSARPPKSRCFRPPPPSACQAYIVFELTLAGRLTGTIRPHQGPTSPGTFADLREYLALDVGQMVNRPDGHAIGWSLDVG